MIPMMANLGLESAAPAVFAADETAERFERHAYESCPKALGPSRLEALPRSDRRRRHRLSYLSMRTQKRVSWLRSV